MKYHDAKYSIIIPDLHIEVFFFPRAFSQTPSEQPQNHVIWQTSKTE
jgi:hypothetical protein